MKPGKAMNLKLITFSPDHGRDTNSYFHVTVRPHKIHNLNINAVVI